MNGLVGAKDDGEADVAGPLGVRGSSWTRPVRHSASRRVHRETSTSAVSALDLAEVEIGPTDQAGSGELVTSLDGTANGFDWPRYDRSGDRSAERRGLGHRRSRALDRDQRLDVKR